MKKKLQANPWSMILRDTILWSVGMFVGIVTVPLFLPESPLLLVAVIFMVWSIYCTKRFLRTIMKISRLSILQPFFDAALKYSLDDILSFIFDPRNLISYITGMWLCPVVLYTLPTTPEERAQVLYSTGMIPSPSTTNFTRPGEWKKLVPEPFQNWIDSSSTTRIHDDDQNEPEEISSSEEVEVDSEVDPSSCDATRNVCQSRKHTKQNQKHLEPHEIMLEIVTRLLQEKSSIVMNRIQEKRPVISCTMILTSIILGVQLTNSVTARRNLRSLAHLLISIVSATGLSASAMALLLPQLYQRRDHLDLYLQRIQRWLSKTNDHSVWITSITATLAVAASSTGNQRRLVLQILRKWKGLAAVLVLYYLKRRRQHHRQHA